MKHYEYIIRADKDVFETKQPHYTIEVSTNNYACYQALKDGINDVVSEYEEAEAKSQEEVPNAD